MQDNPDPEAREIAARLTCVCGNVIAEHIALPIRFPILPPISAPQCACGNQPVASGNLLRSFILTTSTEGDQ